MGDTQSQILSSLTTNYASATAVVLAAGFAIVGISFVSYLLRKANRAANGRV